MSVWVNFENDSKAPCSTSSTVDKAETACSFATPSEGTWLERSVTILMKRENPQNIQATREVGSKVSVSLPVEKYDETVLVGLKAQDEEGRRGDLSNLVSIYVESLPTTTVPTIPTTSNPTSPTTTALPRTYTAKTFWLVVGSLLLFLLLLLCLVATWCMCRRRSEGGEEWKEEGGSGWREDRRREGGGGSVVQVGERRAATKQEWEMRRGARGAGWEVSGRGLEVEERIEERRAPPRYENPPDILPNPNSDGLGRAVRFQPIKVSRENSSVSQHQVHRHRSMMKTNGSLGHGQEEDGGSSDEDTMNRGSSPSSSILAFKLEEPQPRQALDPLYYISNDLELRRGEADLSRSNSSLAQRQREEALKLHRRRLQNAQVLDGKGRQGPPTAPKPRVRHAPPPPSSSSTSPSLSSEEGEEEQVDMEEQDYIRHVTNTNMKGPGVENRPFNYIAFR